MDFPGRLIAGLACIIVLLLFPLQYIAQSSSEDIDALVCNKTKALADDIRKKGYIDKKMYEEYIDFLNHTGELYDFEIEDIQAVTAEELAYRRWHDEFDHFYNECASHTYTALFKPLLSADSIMAQDYGVIKTNSSVSSVHTHSDDCYNGTKHVHTGSPSSGGGCYGGSPVTSRCNASLIYSDYRESRGPISFKCSVTGCPGWCSGETIYLYIRCANGHYYTSHHIKTEWRCDTCSASFYQGQSQVPSTCAYVYSSSYTLNCGKTEGLYYNGNTQVSATCNQVVVSITANNPSQTVIEGSSIDTTISATYLDGHTASLSGDVSGYNPNILGNQTVTLIFRGLVGNAKTTGELTCSVNVTVLPKKSLSYITVSPASQIIDRLANPSFTVTAYYSDGTYAVLSSSQYMILGFDSSKTGSQTVTISHTDYGSTKTATAVVNVNGLTAISLSPAEITVERYTPVSLLNFTVIASYLYGENKTYKSGYQINGYRPSELGWQEVTVSFTDRGITKSTTGRINVTVLKKECPTCHNIYDLLPDDSDPGCPFCSELITGITVSPNYLELIQGDYLTVTVEAIYRNGSKGEVFGWTSNYNPDLIGIQNVIIEYGGFAAAITVNLKEREITCPVCGTQYPASEGECPSCREEVIAISVEPNSVIVRQHENIDITVTAFFANGSSRIVNDWSIDCTTARPGSYKATVTYRAASTIIDLMVLSVTDEQCPICGFIFDKVDYPNGCPVCFTTLIGIEAYLLSESNKVQYGAIPDIAVVLIFRDEHREMITDGYVLENYNPFMLGIQTVTVKYAGFSTSLILELVNSLTVVTCPKGHVYYLNEDGTDPGCPYCRLEGSIGTVRIYDISYTSDILDELYEKGVYQFKRGNLITIRLVKKDKSLLYKMLKMFFKTSLPGRRKSFVFGGEVF